MNTRQIVLIYISSLLVAPALMACSGPGAPMLIARNNAISFVGIIFGALIAIPIVWLRLRRLEENAPAFIPLLALVINPRWIDSGIGGDCGMFLADAAYFYSFCWVALLVYEIARTITHKSVKKTKYARTGAKATAALILLAGAIYLIPWTLDPRPEQESYLYWEASDYAAVGQDEYKQKYGIYASSAHDIQIAIRTNQIKSSGIPEGMFEEYLNNSDAADPDLSRYSHYSIMLQGTAENPRAWQVEGGLSDWAVLARPNDYPDYDDWVQYLFMSDNTIWTKPDPGTGEYLLEGVPPDLAKDGWTKEQQD